MSKSFDWTAPYYGTQHAERDGRKATLSAGETYTNVSLWRRGMSGSVEFVGEQTFNSLQHGDHYAQAKAVADQWLAANVIELAA